MIISMIFPLLRSGTAEMSFSPLDHILRRNVKIITKRLFPPEKNETVRFRLK